MIEVLLEIRKVIIVLILFGLLMWLVKWKGVVMELVWVWLFLLRLFMMVD